MISHPVHRSDIEAAMERLNGHVRRTPVMTVDGSELGLDPDLDVTISLKLEYLQQSGTFKARGATHFLLTNTISEAGVAAASGGNHGAAVAWAAQRLGHRASIFVPTISAPTKVDRLRGYGAEVHQVGAVYAESLEACEAHQERTGATGIHAYEAPDVFAGAGTTGAEFEQQVADAGQPRLDSVVVACGGGGLIGGIAQWFDRRQSSGEEAGNDQTEVVACETDGTAAYAKAAAAGEPVDVEVSGVAADALGASRIGTLAFGALRAIDATSSLVGDAAVIEARRYLWDRFRIVVEPSAAVPIAAIRAGAWQPKPGSHVGVVVCGANTAVADLD